MQPSVSLFPRGTPGIGLVALRLSVAAGLVLHDPLASLPLPSGLTTCVTGTIFIGVLSGFITPWIAATYCLGIITLLPIVQSGGSALSLAVIGLSAAALAMLGPGAYSVDSLLFGRRKVRIPD